MPTDKKKKKRVSPSRPKPPRRASAKGLKAPRNRDKSRAQKGAIYQSKAKKKGSR